MQTLRLQGWIASRLACSRLSLGPAALVATVTVTMALLIGGLVASLTDKPFHAPQAYETSSELVGLLLIAVVAAPIIENALIMLSLRALRTACEITRPLVDSLPLLRLAKLGMLTVIVSAHIAMSGPVALGVTPLCAVLIAILSAPMKPGGSGSPFLGSISVHGLHNLFLLTLLLAL